MTFIKTSSPETVRSYRSDLSQAFELNFSPEKALQAVDFEKAGASKPALIPDQVLLDACRQALSRWSHLAPSSRNRKAATLKSFLGWLLEEGAISRDLAAHIHAPKVPSRLPHYLSVDEILSLLKSLREALANCDDDKRKRHARVSLVLVLTLYGGGLRISEACGLKWSQVSTDARTLRVVGKGGKERIVAVPPLVARELMQLASEANPGHFVFSQNHLTGEPLPVRKAYDIVRSAGSQAGLLKPLHPHALRHSFATHLLASGANLRTLQELLGHSTLQATSRYTHLGIDQLARTLEEFHPLNQQAPKSSKS